MRLYFPFSGYTAKNPLTPRVRHYIDVIMSPMASQITSLMIVYSTVYSHVDQRKHQSSALLAFGRGIHRWPVNSQHKGPVTRKMFSFDDVIMVAAFYVKKLVWCLCTTCLKLQVWVSCARLVFNTLKLRQNGRHFPDDILTSISLNEYVWIPINISLKFVPTIQSNQQYSSNDSDNGLAPIRSKTIIWTNDG